MTRYSVAVGRWTRDQEIAGSTPTAALFGQQPWASCSHLKCLCSPSSITWSLRGAFTPKAPYCWQRHRVQWTRGYCRAVLRWLSNCIEPRYKSSALRFTSWTVLQPTVRRAWLIAQRERRSLTQPLTVPRQQKRKSRGRWVIWRRPLGCVIWRLRYSRIQDRMGSSGLGLIHFSVSLAIWKHPRGLAQRNYLAIL